MIYFVSDIHLGGGDRALAERTERAFCAWLDSIASDVTHLYLLGDVFDFWFEYHRVVPQGFVRVLGRLAALTDRGVGVTLYTGNHDMWCHDYLERECGVELVRTPRVERLGELDIHLAHGDNMNIKGNLLLKMMNATFRSSVVRWLFGWLVHPDLALKFGRWWSGKSRKSHGSEQISADRLDYLVEYAREHRATNGNVAAYIFGHMHLAHRRTEEGGLDVLFLSDWSRREATYATMDADNKLNLKTFDIDEAVSRLAQ
ncbi:MAG: UDP-2,3-diacylglucosamine diphosphatase [Alistipes sp.]|nr:UDP-2,3-diacylglucosamine diphosphatase [Alistipes sp.]